MTEESPARQQPILSLAGKLIIMSVLVIVGISFLFWWPSVVHMQKKELKRNIAFAESQMEVVKRALHFGMLTNHRDGVRQTVESLAATQDILWIKVLDGHGAIRFFSAKNGADTAYLKFLDGGTEKSRLTKDANGHRAIVTTEPILNAPSCYTAKCHVHPEEERILGRIEVALSLKAADAAIRKQGLTIASFGVVFILALSIPLYLIVRLFVLRPVALLTEGIRKVASGDLSHAITAGSKDEFGMLADNFNAMTGKLQERNIATAKELDHYRASLLQAQKMEAVGTLSAGIAHDFNNILTGITGYSELAAERVSDATVKEYLERVLELTRKAADFTRQILLIGRKLPPARQSVDVNCLIEDSMKMLRRMVEESVEIRLSLEPDLHPVDGDPSQITQILMNLVVNAREAMDKGGVIEIRTEEAVVDGEYCRRYAYAKTGGYVTISVKDRGKGIPEEIRDRIFEPFFSTKSSKGKGTGLGLAVTYSIVKAHGGWISLYSEVGKGTEFRVYLPVVSSTAGFAAGLRDKHELPRGTETILLADDEEVIRGLGSSILSELGYSVITASDGEDAVKIFRESRADVALVIMDRVMPKLNGIEAYHRLREIDPGIKVIISSGYAADEAKGLKDAGVLGFLDKPYRVSELARTVRKAIDGGEIGKP